MSFSLSDLGWSSHFAAQHAAHGHFMPFRITAIHRDRLVGMNETGEMSLLAPGHSTGDFAVGDWVLADDQSRVQHLLDRRSLLQRRAAGTGAESAVDRRQC